MFGRRRKRGRLVFIVQTPNHLGILDLIRPACEAAGLKPEVWLVTGLPESARAREAIEQRGLPLRNAAKKLEVLQAGDVAIFFLVSWMRDQDRIASLLGRGVRLLQLSEGCRFNFPGLTHPDVPFLGWGPSARVAGRQLRIVGSPVSEAAPRGPALAARPAKALINVKFRGHEPARATWLDEVLGACTDAGLTPVFSGHPVLCDGFDVEFDPRPVAQLCAELPVVISRPSTVIYEALVAGAQPFLMPTRGEGQVEFADPRGAFPIALTGAELTGQLRRWQAAQGGYDPAPFLEAHVDIDPNRPAAQRIVREVQAELRQ